MFSCMKKTLVLLLIALKGSGPAAAACSSSSCAADPACACRSNQRLTAVPQDLPTNITSLLLDQNRIQAVQQDEFSRYGSLEVLNLGQNLLSRIDSRTFYNLTKLRRLDLSVNRLNTSRLAVDAFVGLSNLETLSLIGNEFTSLVGTMFVGLGNLAELYLFGNPLSTIQGNPFAQLGSLKVLELDLNRLTSLTADMFVGLSNLETVKLDYNEITSVESATFHPTPRLKNLSMTGNKISTIPDGTFVNQHQIQSILLSENRINTFNVAAFRPNSTWWSSLDMGDNRMEILPAAAYDLLASFASVTISNNPWQCDCRMVPFKQKMNGSHVFESQIMCAGPASLAGKSLLHNLSVADLVCQPTTTPRGQPEMTETNCGPAIGMSTLLVFLAASLGKVAAVPYYE